MTSGTKSETGHDLCRLLLDLELHLLNPATRADRAKVSPLLTNEFVEFGSSGRVWSREEILLLLEQEADWQPPAIVDFAIQK